MVGCGFGSYDPAAMSKLGSIIETGGKLVREGDRLIFRANSGGRWFVEPERIEEVHIGCRGELRGVVVGTDQLAVERFVPEE